MLNVGCQFKFINTLTVATVNLPVSDATATNAGVDIYTYASVPTLKTTLSQPAYCEIYKTVIAN